MVGNDVHRDVNVYLAYKDDSGLSTAALDICVGLAQAHPNSITSYCIVHFAATRGATQNSFRSQSFRELHSRTTSSFIPENLTIWSHYAGDNG